MKEALKQFLRTSLGMGLYLLRRKKAVYIISAQRSGSTLLKALLANKSSISHLPEVSPEPYAAQKYTAQYYYFRLTREPVIVFKMPRSPRAANYPFIGPGIDRYIFLFRNPVDTALSMLETQREVVRLGKMPPFEKMPHGTNGEILEASLHYWLETYRMMSAAAAANTEMQIKYICYEQLVENPAEIIRALLAFIGVDSSEVRTTYDCYDEERGWLWGRDDGGEMIKQKKVIARTPTPLTEETRRRYELDHTLFENCRQVYEELLLRC